MTDPATKNHNVLLEMSTLAEHGVEQARKAFEELMNATHRAVQTFEGQTTAAQAAARDLQQQAMSFAARNVTASFEFAQNLVRAKSAEEVAKLHAAFVSADEGPGRPGARIDGKGQFHQPASPQGRRLTPSE